jgi:alanine racemase
MRIAMGRPTVVEIDLRALRFNLNQLRGLTGGKADILGVVKANAYGHGAVPVAKELEAAGASIFGVATTEEGIELRLGGVTSPILILAGTYPQEFDRIVVNRLTPVIYDLEIAQAFQARAERSKGRLPVHLKVDTGMSRLGIPWWQWEEALEILASCKRLRVEGLMSHFSAAEGEGAEDRAFTEEQLARFTQCLDLARKKGMNPRHLHLANSAAATLREPARFNLVRPGLMLYGVHPSPALRPLVSLTPVLRWKTAVLSLKRVPRGTPVSYGRTFRCARESLIAVLPVGYADGYSRRLSNRGEVLIQGRRARVAGIVCMDLTMVDVTEVPGVKVGDEVVLLGRQGGDEISAVEMAGWAESISYEVLCGIGKRVPRVYDQGGEPLPPSP